MIIYRFDPEAGRAAGQFGSVKAIIAQILVLDENAVISSILIQPGDKTGYNQAGLARLLLLAQGEGWTRAGDSDRLSIREGQAIFWDQGEWFEAGSETGMITVMIEGLRFDPDELMPLLERDEP